MSFVSELFTVPTSVAASDPITVNPRGGCFVAVAGTFTATLQVQFSPLRTGDVWFTQGTFTAKGFTEIDAGRARRVRINVSAYTSGTPKAVVVHDRSLQALRKETEFIESVVAIPTSVAAGAAVSNVEFRAALFSINGTFVATVNGEFNPTISADSDFWFRATPDLTAAGNHWVPKGMARHLRANTSAYTSGTPSGRYLLGELQEDVQESQIETVTSGAVPLNRRTVLFSVTGTVGFTLADGLFEGQRISGRCITAASTPNGTLTPTTFADGTSIDIDAVNESFELEWHQIGGWRVVYIIGSTITA